MLIGGISLLIHSADLLEPEGLLPPHTVHLPPSTLGSPVVCGLGLVRGWVWNRGLKLAGLNSGEPHQASALCEVSLSDAPWGSDFC